MLPHSSPEWIRSPPPRIGQSGTSGMSGITRSAACCVCALSPSTVFSRFLWVTATVGASFLFVRNGLLAGWIPLGRAMCPWWTLKLFPLFSYCITAMDSWEQAHVWTWANTQGWHGWSRCASLLPIPSDRHLRCLGAQLLASPVLVFVRPSCRPGPAGHWCISWQEHGFRSFARVPLRRVFLIESRYQVLRDR